MEAVFFLKPLVDMLYVFQFLDVILMVFCIYCFFTPRFKITPLKTIDIVALVLMLLFLFSFIRNPKGWSQFLKIESSFLLYFLGRFYKMGFPKLLQCLQRGFIPVLVVTVIAFLAKTGFVYWGQINTFKGVYYFKTDLALAMTQCFIVYGYHRGHNNKLLRYLILACCLFFILIANARIYYLIMGLVLFITACYYYELKNRRIIVRLNFKFWLYAAMLLVLTVLIMIWLNGILGGSLLLVDPTDGLYGEANTQGRSIVWAEIYDIFANSNLLSRFMGIDLCSDISPSLGHNSHSLYLKILFSTGYVGCLFFLFFIVLILKTISSLDNRFYFYITLTFFIMFILGGVSYITIESTQATWIAMFIVGKAVTLNNRKNAQLR